MSMNKRISEQVDGLLRAHSRPHSSLAPLLGLSQQAVSDRFRSRTPWTVEDLTRIAAEFGVEAADLLYTRAVA